LGRQCHLIGTRGAFIRGATISKAEAEQQFRPYGGRLVASFNSGFDLWEFGWGVAFTLSNFGDRYTVDDVGRAWTLLWKTKPDDWQRQV
jgi:hypothetical protein